MSSSEELFPDIPSEIRSARIGSCYNSLTGKIIEGVYAIDPQKVSESQIFFTSGKGELKCTANSTSRESSNGSLFRLNAEVDAGYQGVIAGISGSLSFNMELASKSVSNDEAFNCFCSYIFEDQFQTLVKMTSDEIYQSMSTMFHEAYEAVVNSNSIEEYLLNYFNFIDKFGHGCVTQLFLTAGSAFKLSVVYNERSNAVKQKYGGSLSVSGHYGGGWGNASVASDWANEIDTSNMQSNMNVSICNIPENAPTADWCNQMMNNFLMVKIFDLTKKVSLITPPVNLEKLPDPKVEGKPQDIKRPKMKKKVNQNEFDSKMKKQLMKEDNFSGTWDDYIKYQEELYKTLKPEEVIKAEQNL